MSDISSFQTVTVPVSKINPFDFQTFIQEEPSLLYYDVFIDMYIDGKNKSLVNRVSASSFKEAFITGIDIELHTPLNVESLVNAFLDANKLPFNQSIQEDDSVIYSITNIVRLRKYPVKYPTLMADNSFLVKYVLLPDVIESMYDENYYFAK